MAKWKIDDITRNPKEWITEIKLIRGDLKKLDWHIDDSEMMTHILSNLPEEYHTIMEILEDKLDGKFTPLTIDKYPWQAFSENWLNKQTNRNKAFNKRLKPPLRKSQYNGTRKTFGEYRHKGKDCWHKEGVSVPKCHYLKKPGHVKKDYWKRIREEKPERNTNKDNNKKCNYYRMKNIKKTISTRGKRRKINLQTTSQKT